MSYVSESVPFTESYDRTSLDNLLLSKIFRLTDFSNDNKIATVDSTVT